MRGHTSGAWHHARQAVTGPGVCKVHARVRMCAYLMAPHASESSASKITSISRPDQWPSSAVRLLPMTPRPVSPPSGEPCATLCASASLPRFASSSGLHDAAGPRLVAGRWCSSSFARERLGSLAAAAAVKMVCLGRGDAARRALEGERGRLERGCGGFRRSSTSIRCISMGSALRNSVRLTAPQRVTSRRWSRAITSFACSRSDRRSFSTSRGSHLL